jgi:hypothetical protein
MHRPRGARGGKPVEIVAGTSDHGDVEALAASTDGLDRHRDTLNSFHVDSERKDVVITSRPRSRPIEPYPC